MIAFSKLLLTLAELLFAFALSTISSNHTASGVNLLVFKSDEVSRIQTDRAKVNLNDFNWLLNVASDKINIYC